MQIQETASALSRIPADDFCIMLKVFQRWENWLKIYLKVVSHLTGKII